MSTSHPLHPFFTPFKPVAHPLQPLFLQWYRCCSQRFRKLYIPIGMFCYCAAQNARPPFAKPPAPVAAGYKHSDRRPATQYGHERRYPVEETCLERQNRRGGPVLMRGRTLQQNKPGRGEGNLPSDRGEEEDGPQGKRGEGPPGWVRPLFVHDENDRLVRCSPPSRLVLLEKRGSTLRA